MAEFIPDTGKENCPKCFGWQVLDKTVRHPKTFEPLGLANVVECDRCEGSGQIPLRQAWERPKSEPAPEPKSMAQGWAMFNKGSG